MGSAVSFLCLIRSSLIPIDIYSKNFLLQNKALQKQEALEIRMSFLVLKKVAEIFTHCEEEKASTYYCLKTSKDSKNKASRITTVQFEEYLMD